MLPSLAELFTVSIDELLGHASRTQLNRGPTPRLARRQERIGQLRKPKRRVVLEVLEAVLAQAGR
jgi:hypothetical protein